MMLRMLTLLGTMGAAWTLSQYLPSENLAKDSERTAAIVTRAIPVAGGKPADQRSVALIDLAVSALPTRSSEPNATDFQPAAPVTTARPKELVISTVSAAVTESATTGAEPDEEQENKSADDPKLTRKIQSELRRVGCLRSAADGVWGSGTKRAMRRFAERIDADLPVDGPDAVLLILLQRFEDRACGRACPAGEAPNANGRCRAVETMAKNETGAKPALQTDVAVLAEDTTVPPVGEGTSEEMLAKSAAELASDQSSKAKPRRAKARIVRTTVGRVGKPKRVRIARATPRRKTRWALPRYYGIGVAYTKPARVASAPKKRKRRLGAAAAYRRWLERSAIAMR